MNRRIPKHTKLRGEWAELLFMAHAYGEGFQVARSLGDSYRWDVIVEHKYGFHRVQVKATAVRHRGGYVAHYYNLGGTYTPKDFDFYALYVIPEDVWYIIPSKVVRGRRSIFVDPRTDRARNRYSKYREAWHLLKQPGRFNIHACADDGGSEHRTPGLEYIQLDPLRADRPSRETRNQKLETASC